MELQRRKLTRRSLVLSRALSRSLALSLATSGSLSQLSQSALSDCSSLTLSLTALVDTLGMNELLTKASDVTSEGKKSEAHPPLSPKQPLPLSEAASKIQIPSLSRTF